MKITAQKMRENMQKHNDMAFLIAYASLKANGEPTDENNIEAEKARIERIAQQFYLNAEDEEYHGFMIKWLRENARDIVYTDKFVYDTNIPDEQFELNINLFCK